MLLANVRVGNSKGSWKGESKPSGGSSLKNIKNVRLQIEKQERIKKKLNRASQESKAARKSLEVELEIKKAFEKLSGRKVHDNLTLLKKAEKRLVRKKGKSAERWSAKQDEVKKSQQERQAKRNENLQKARSKQTKKAPVVKISADGVKTQAKPAAGSTRKQRRHENLMKFGPKKTREEREDNRKKARKDRKGSKKPNREKQAASSAKKGPKGKK